MQQSYLCLAKQMNDNTWHEGYYVEGLDIRGNVIHLIFELNSMFYSYGETDGFVEIDPATICRCTGLRDTFGKLIFEHDVVSFNYDYAVVVWDKAEWRIKWLKENVKRKDLYFWTNENKEICEIIGNLIDRQELLESYKG